MAKNILIESKPSRPKKPRQKRFNSISQQIVLDNESFVSLYITNVAVRKLNNYLALKLNEKGRGSLSPSDMLSYHILGNIMKKQGGFSILASDLGINNDKII